MDVQKYECVHCGKEFMPQHYAMHQGSLRKKGIEIPTLDQMRNGSGNTASSITVQNLKTGATISFFDCPHCSGMLVMGDGKVDHVSDLRTFLKSVTT